MDSKKRLVPKKLRFRIVVSIPLILTLFTLGSGLITLNLGMALYPEMPIFPQVIWTIIFLGIIACLSGIGIAYSIIHPLKKIATKIETTLI
ncbi:MAG: hypothetical protein GWP10_03175, partial [Nitrospiraceae bacterium]|nr:hypothetical protein [Nitrospiraceae bacterium]